MHPQTPGAWLKMSPVCDIAVTPGISEANIRVEITLWIKYMYRPAHQISQDTPYIHTSLDKWKQIQS